MLNIEPLICSVCKSFLCREVYNKLLYGYTLGLKQGNNTMGFFDTTLKKYGYEREEQTKGIKQKDYATATGALGSIVGANSWNPAFSSFNNEKQQLLAYRDWVYIAARAVAEQCAAVDL